MDRQETTRGTAVNFIIDGDGEDAKYDQEVNYSALHIEVGGILEVLTRKGTKIVTIPGVLAGWHPIACRKIISAGTTCTGIVGFE